MPKLEPRTLALMSAFNHYTAVLIGVYPKWAELSVNSVKSLRHELGSI